MRIRKAWSIVLTVILLALLGAGLWAGAVQAQPPLQQPVTGTTIPYPGHLTGDDGQPVADGTYAFTFALYNTATDGDSLWSETQEGVAVQGGAFLVSLGSVEPIPTSVPASNRLWLEVTVRGPTDNSFTLLSPRQQLSAVSPQASAPQQAAPCPHNHWGEFWSSETGSGLSLDRLSGMFLQNGAALARDDGTGVYGYSLMGGNGVWGTALMGTGVYGLHSAPDGVSYGVLGETTSASGAYGVYGRATTTTGYSTGVGGNAYSTDSVGGRFYNEGGGVALWAAASGAGRDRPALRVNNQNSSNGIATYMTNASGYATAHFANSGSGEVLYLQNAGDADGNGGGPFISAMSSDESDLQFAVLSSGEARSDVGFNTPASDMAEMLPGVAGLEPGDVLAIGPDGKLTRSTEPYQVAVAGVYSTRPGFVGGYPVEGKIAGTIPLAVVGVVPVKASAENGPIRPGDLLVASSTPGYAMKAGPNPPQGTVIGKALASLSTGTGLIQMLVTLQ